MNISNRGYRIILEKLVVLMKEQEIKATYEDYLENVTDGNEQAAAILVLASIAARFTDQTEKKVSETNQAKGEGIR